MDRIIKKDFYFAVLDKYGNHMYKSTSERYAIIEAQRRPEAVTVISVCHTIEETEVWNK